MRKTYWIILLGIFLSSRAWSALTIGDFTLGSPKKEVLQVLDSHFLSVKEVTASRYQVEKRFISATQPIGAYMLGGIAITKVNVFFNHTGELNQVEIVLDTTRLEDVKKQIPEVEKSQLEPLFKNSWEVFLDDGEIVYWISTLSGSAQISFADKATSKTNVEARRISNQRFKGMTDKLDNIIETLKKN